MLKMRANAYRKGKHLLPNIPNVAQQLEGHTCITEHPGFHSNYLDRYVLQTSYYEYVEADGPIDVHVAQNEYV